MRKLMFGLGLIGLLMPAAAGAQTYVSGYTKSDGTYVAPYYRSSPNGTTADNYSTKGNINPYTGQAGTKSPNPAPAYKVPTYTPPQSFGSSYTTAPKPTATCNDGTVSYSANRSGTCSGHGGVAVWR